MKKIGALEIIATIALLVAILLAAVAVVARASTAATSRSTNRDDVVVAYYGKPIRPPTKSVDLPKPFWQAGDTHAAGFDYNVDNGAYLVLPMTSELMGPKFRVFIECYASNLKLIEPGLLMATSPRLPTSFACWISLGGMFNFRYYYRGVAVRSYTGKIPVPESQYYACEVKMDETRDARGEPIRELTVTCFVDEMDWRTRDLASMSLGTCDLYIGGIPTLPGFGDQHDGLTGKVRRVYVNGVEQTALPLYAVGPVARVPQ